MIISWNLNAVILLSSSTIGVTPGEPGYRIYVVQDMQQASDTAPTGAMLVDQPALPFTQLLNINMQKRFRVLWDSKPQMVISGTSAATVVSSAVFVNKIHFNITKKVKISQRWNGAANTDIQKNGIYVFYYTNMVAAGPAATLDVSATSRCAFVDS